MIERFIEELHTNSCIVHGPMEVAAARRVIVERTLRQARRSCATAMSPCPRSSRIFATQAST